MSCWRNYSCKALKDVNLENLKKALSEMGLTLNMNKTTVHGIYEGRSAKVDGVLVSSGKELSLGLVVNGEDGCVEVVGDFWRTGLNEADFNANLGKIYQKIEMLSRLELSGYTVESVEETADGGVEIEAYAWA